MKKWIVGKMILLVFIQISGIVSIVLASRTISQEEQKSGNETQNTPKMFESVRLKIEEAMDKTGVPSIAVAVAKDGKIIWEEGFGWADREKGIKTTSQTMYHLASISKAMTVTGLMVLVERDLIDLEKPVNDYLGESKLTTQTFNADQVLIKHLLYHTAGLPMHWNLLNMYNRVDMDESIRRYGILVTPPGKQYSYSNFGYGIIDYIIMRVSGKNYKEYMRDELFVPLSMTRTSVLLDSSLVQYTAKMYGPNQQLLPNLDYDHRGASAVISSVHDLVRFGMFHIGCILLDQKPLLKKETIKRMHSEVGLQFSEEKGKKEVDYLLGSFGKVNYRGYCFEVTSGYMPVGGAMSRLTLLPSENIVTALLSNGSNIDIWSIEKLIYEKLLPDFEENAETDSENPSDNKRIKAVPPKSFLGDWSGDIFTYSGKIPIIITFSDTNQIRMDINGKGAIHLNMKTPLGEMGFKDNSFRSIFMGSIKTSDAMRFPHIILMDCQRKNECLTGTASAVAMNRRFCLPYYVELKHFMPENLE